MAVSRGVGRRRGLDPGLLWLWPAAAALGNGRGLKERRIWKEGDAQEGLGRALGPRPPSMVPVYKVTVFHTVSQLLA